MDKQSDKCQASPKATQRSDQSPGQHSLEKAPEQSKVKDSEAPTQELAPQKEANSSGTGRVEPVSPLRARIEHLQVVRMLKERYREERRRQEKFLDNMYSTPPKREKVPGRVATIRILLMAMPLPTVFLFSFRVGGGQAQGQASQV